MSLTTMHQLATLGCVVAAVLMLVRARGTLPRAAHGVVLAGMVVLAVTEHQAVVVLGVVAVLVATAALIAPRTDAALDVAACAGLALLVHGPAALLGHTAAPGPDEHGLHAQVHAAIPGGVDHQVGLALLAAGLTVAWCLAARPRRSLEREVSPAPAARWLMGLAMAAMAASAS